MGEVGRGGSYPKDANYLFLFCGLVWRLNADKSVIYYKQPPNNVTCILDATEQTVHLYLYVLFANSGCNAYCEVLLPAVTQSFRWKTLKLLELQSLSAICKTVHCSRVVGTSASY